MTGKPLFFTLFFMMPPVVVWSQTAENPQKPSTYVVKKGDCLWNISKRVWGDPQKWPLLFATNEDQIKNPNLIYPGQEFKIPATITNEELKKATKLAQERAVPLPAGQIGAKGTALTDKKHKVTASPSEPSASSSASKLAPATTAPSANGQAENTTNPPATSQTNQPAGTTTPSSGSSTIVIFVVALLALGAGLFFWFRRRAGAAAQQPRPLSSFPQAGEPPVSRPVNPSTTPSQAPSNPPLSTPISPIASPTSQPVVSTPRESNPPEATPAPQTAGNTQPTPASIPPGNKAGGFTGTITSISMSQPPVPSKAEPLSSPSSSVPPVPAPSTPPAQKPPESNSPDSSTPPSSTSQN